MAATVRPSSRGTGAQCPPLLGGSVEEDRIEAPCPSPQRETAMASHPLHDIEYFTPLNLLTRRREVSVPHPASRDCGYCGVRQSIKGSVTRPGTVKWCSLVPQEIGAETPVSCIKYFTSKRSSGK